MHRIDDRTVELTLPERLCRMSYDEALHEGLGIAEAAKRALNEHGLNRPRHAAFVEWLSDSTCEVKAGRVIVKREWRTPEVATPTLVVVDGEVRWA